MLYTDGMGALPETLMRLQTTLGDIRGLVSAYVFGSIAEGREHRESDVDLGVLLDRRIYPSNAERFDVRLRLIPQASGFCRPRGRPRHPQRRSASSGETNHV